MNERVILRTVNEGEVSRCFLVDPLFSWHFEGIKVLLCAGAGGRSGMVKVVR